MALTIVYYGGADAITKQIYGPQVVGGTVSVTLTGTDAALGPIPSGAAFARFTAGEICTVANNGQPSSATNGQPLLANEAIDLEVPRNGAQFRGKL